MKIQVTTTLAAEDRATIAQGSRQMPGGAVLAAYDPLYLTLRDHYQSLVGGAFGNTGAGWCYLNAMWIAEGSRKLGWGSQLLAQVEAEARRRGCRHIYLDTFSDLAAGFYQKNQYTIFATLEDFPGERQRVFFRKDLYP